MGSDAFGRYLVSEVNRVERLALARRGGGPPVATGAPRLAVVLTAVLVLSLVMGRRAAGSASVARRRWRPVALILGAMLVNIAVSERAGFVAGAAILFAATAIAFGDRRLVRVVPVAVGFALVTFLLFRGVLGVALPVGSWWGGA